MADHEPMGDERLREIESRLDTLSGFSISDPVKSPEMFTMGMDLLAEVYRLRAKQADDDALSLQFGSRHLADGEEIRLENEHDAWNHEADLLQKEARRVQAENGFLRARCETVEALRDAWNRTATEYKDESFAAKKRLAEAQAIIEAVADIENSDGSACFVTCELVMYDSELDPPDEIRHTSPCIIEQARAFLAARQAAESEGE